MRAFKNQGFTLLELIVVLFVVILGFSAIGISLSSGNDATKLKSTARDLTSALRYAKGTSLMTKQETSLNIDFAENTYQITGRSKVYEIPQSIDVTMHTGQNEIGNGVAGIRFFPDGSSSGGWIKLEQGKLAWRIDVNWLTGHIELNDVTS